MPRLRTNAHVLGLRSSLVKIGWQIKVQKLGNDSAVSTRTMDKPLEHAKTLQGECELFSAASQNVGWCLAHGTILTGSSNVRCGA